MKFLFKNTVRLVKDPLDFRNTIIRNKTLVLINLKYLLVNSSPECLLFVFIANDKFEKLLIQRYFTWTHFSQLTILNLVIRNMRARRNFLKTILLMNVDTITLCTSSLLPSTCIYLVEEYNDLAK